MYWGSPIELCYGFFFIQYLIKFRKLEYLIEFGVEDGCGSFKLQSRDLEIWNTLSNLEYISSRDSSKPPSLHKANLMLEVEETKNEWA